MRTQVFRRVSTLFAESNNAIGDIILAADDISFVDSGAVGVFIQGLEDEFMEVRDATLDSVCELSTTSDDFAYPAVDYIVGTYPIENSI